MTLDLPGFADPVADAQAAFRAVLDAMAHPGRIENVGEGLTAPAPLCPAVAAVLLTLVDADTPVWLCAAAEAAADWALFHCGAAITAPADAVFAVTMAAPDWTMFDAGSHEAPEDGATLIVQVAALGVGQPYTLSGPGLRAPGTLRIEGLPLNFASAWATNHARFPRGFDLILCAGTQLAALPRSVAVS